MTFFLPAGYTGDASLLDGDIPSNTDVMGAAWTAETIETDAYWRRGREESALMSELQTQLYGAGAVFSDMRTQAQMRGDFSNPDFLADAADVAQFDPAAWGNLPTNQADFDAEVSRRLRAEHDEATSVLRLGGDGAGWAEFGGRAARAMTDETSLPLMLLGAPAGVGVKGTIAVEAGLGVAGEAMILPKMFRVADELDLPEPNVAMQLGMGAVAGGALGGMMKGAQRGFEYLRTRGDVTGEVVPEGVSAIEHDQFVENTLAALNDGEAVPAVEAQAPDAVRWRDAIAAVESRGSGDYGALGPVMSSGSYAGDRAYGRYQIMGRNIPAWSQEHLGREISIEEFMENPALQDAIFDGEFGGYVERFGNPQDAASMWFTGRPWSEGGSRSDGNINGNEYVRRFNTAFDDPPTPGHATRAGYTTYDQVVAPTGTRIDVGYEVVDASTLLSAHGRFQPRDRSRASSDEQIALMAAQLDPARLMPSPEADRGAPIVGADNMIESGNGRVAAIVRAAEEHPDRYAAYVDQVRSQFDIPEGISQPVLIARRTSEFSDDARQAFVQDANTSGIARMSATEQSAMDARSLDDDVLALYEQGSRLDAPQNRRFVQAALAHIPQAERSGLVTSTGALNLDGVRRLQQGLFARAYDAPDLIARYTEGDVAEFRSLTEALAEVAPSWAALRAEIASGAIKPEMDLTQHMLDAIRLIGDARETAGRDGVSVFAAVDAAINQGDLLAGEIDPNTAGFVKLFYKGDRVRNSANIAEILEDYIREARNVGRTDATLFDDALSPTSEEILNAVQSEIKFLATGGSGAGERAAPLPRGEGRSGDEGSRGGVDGNLDISGAPVESFRAGAGSPGARIADAASEESLRADVASPQRVDPLDDLADVDPADYVAELAQRQPFETIDELYVRASTAHERLLEVGQRVADDLGIEFKSAKLKDRATAEAKIARKGYTSPKQLTDISRAGFIVESVDDVDRLIGRLGEEFDGIDEGWRRYEAGYIDRKVMLRAPDGTLSEVQIWTRDMLAAKSDGHAVYEKLRVLSREDPQRTLLVNEGRDLYAAAANDFNSIAFSADGISSSPKRLANDVRKVSSDPKDVDVYQTSSASTDTQSAPGSKIASAKNPPDGAVNNTAGRRSQSQNDFNSITDTPSVGDTINVNTIRDEIKTGGDFEFTLDGISYRASELLDDIEADTDLIQIAELCASKGGGHA